MQCLENSIVTQHSSNVTSNLAPCECDKLSANRYTTKRKQSEEILQDSDYEQIEISQGDMKITLGFPKKTEDISSTTDEVKSILLNALYENIKFI